MVLLLLLAPERFRVTLNAPATELVVGGASHLSFRVGKGGEVLVQPTKSGGYALTARGDQRGGLEATVDGPDAASILEALGKSAGEEHPAFFRLTRSPSQAGWFLLESVTQAPPRHVPHLRLWVRAAPPAPEMATTVAEPDWAREVRHAWGVLRAHEASRRVGRPPRDVLEAQQTVDAFVRLARDVLPPSVERASVEAAREVLDRALAK